MQMRTFPKMFKYLSQALITQALRFPIYLPLPRGADRASGVENINYKKENVFFKFIVRGVTKVREFEVLVIKNFVLDPIR